MYYVRRWNSFWEIVI